MTLPVCAVTVTYGERLALLTTMAEAAAAAGVSELLVVGNGIDTGYKRGIEALAARLPMPLTLVELPQNQGSAVGFRAGIERALEASSCPYLWLLDDDNCAAHDALAVLVATHRRLAEGAPASVALCSLRDDRPNYARTARAGAYEAGFPPRSSVMGFDLRSLPAKLRRRFGAAVPESTSRVADSVPIPWGPYGGLFIHRDLLARIGLPETAFLLYGDDTEFTHRITRGGSALHLVPASRIADAEPSWSSADGTGFFMRRLLAARSRSRLYLSVRNDVFFTSRRWCDNRLAYGANVVAFLALGTVTGLMTGRVAQIGTLFRGVYDGLAGRLGGQLGPL